MANRQRGFTTVDLGDGKERKVRFDLNAIAELEDHFGGPLQEVFADAERVKRFTVKDIRKVIWAGLHGAGDFDIREIDVGHIVDFDSITDVMKVVVGALSRANTGGNPEKKAGRRSAHPEPTVLDPDGTGTD